MIYFAMIMARSLFWLSDEAWKTLEPHLPHGKPGKPRVDDRTVISGILHVLKTGCRWRDVRASLGPPTTIYNRYNRWSQRRIWQRIFEKMAAAGPVPDAARATVGWRKRPATHKTPWIEQLLACRPTKCCNGGLRQQACAHRLGDHDARKSIQSCSGFCYHSEIERCNKRERIKSARVKEV